MRLHGASRVLTFFAASLILLAHTVAAQSIDAKKVLDDMIQALGGKAFLEVREIQANGRFYSFKHGNLEGSDLFADYIKFPDMERTEFGSLKNKTVTINRGDQGWTVEGKDVKPHSAAQVDDFTLGFKTSFDYVTRFVLNQPRTTIQYTGSEIIDFKRTDVIEVRDPSKNLMRFYVDRQSHLPAKMQVRRANKAIILEEQYSNWHRFGSVMAPLFVIRLTDNVKTMEVHIQTTTYDSGLAESLFVPPAAAK
jgi:hypothetical protein